ncbi:hypothetical protein D3C80_1228300 [compost metagenome]
MASGPSSPRLMDLRNNTRATPKKAPRKVAISTIRGLRGLTGLVRSTSAVSINRTLPTAPARTMSSSWDLFSSCV